MVVLYSNNCPNCRILKEKLDKKGIEYSENTSVEEMISLGFTHVPMLKVDDKIMDFNEALVYVANH